MKNDKKRQKVEKLLRDLERCRTALVKNHEFYVKFMKKYSPIPGKDALTAIGMSGVFAGFYQTLETFFLKVSGFFENDLSGDRWHQQLLDNMTIQINGMRDRVISVETRNILLDLLKFRHFKRYYTDFDYKWTELEKLEKKYLTVKSLLKEDLKRFEFFSRSCKKST